MDKKRILDTRVERNSVLLDRILQCDDVDQSAWVVPDGSDTRYLAHLVDDLGSRIRGHNNRLWCRLDVRN